MRDQEIIGLYEAYHQVYAPQELTEEVEIAAQYFYEMGLNEDGVDILIEDLGVEEFADWVYEIAEDYTLTEARAGGVRVEPKTKAGKSVGQLKGGAKTAAINRLRKEKEARRSAEASSSAAKPSGMKASLERQSAVANAQKKQPEKSGSPKGIAGRIGAALGGAVNRAKSNIELTKKTAQTVGKAVGTGIEALNRASDTRLARQARVATKQGFKRQQKAMTAAGGALGRLAAKSSAVRDTFNAGQKLGNALRREEVEKLDEIDSSKIARTDLKRRQNLSAAENAENSARDAGATMEVRSKLAANTSAAAAKVSGHRALSTAHARSRARMRAAGQNVNASYEYDTFDTILEYLVAEGYADTNESALAIMANMGEEWRESIFESIDLHEKLRKGTKGKVSFTTGKDSDYNQAMTEKNPKTGRQRGTSPMHKTMVAHSKARQAQHDAEQSGDHEGAQRHAQRRATLAHVVYNKTNRIIDRADND